MCGTSSQRIDRSCEAVPPEFETCSVKWNSPFTVGVPLMTPESVSKWRPSGKVPVYDNVGCGKPSSVTLNEPSEPRVKGAALGEVIEGPLVATVTVVPFELLVDDWCAAPVTTTLEVFTAPCVETAVTVVLEPEKLKVFATVTLV